MRRLKDTIPNGGAPLLEFPVLKTMFDDETKDAIEAILNSITEGETEGVILSGCNVTGTSGSFNISEGYIYADGEVLKYNGGTGFSATRYLRKAAVTEEGGVFADTISKNYINVNEADDFGTTGSGVQYITVTFANGGRRLLNRLSEDKITTVGVQLSTKVVNIGDWNMDTDSSVLIPHGLNYKKIRQLSCIIRDDADTVYTNIEGADSAALANEGNIDISGSTNIVLFRVTGSRYDSTSYDSTSYNRGWVTITYES